MSMNPRRRPEVPAGDRWSVESLFESDASWEAAFAATAGFPARASGRAGTLSSSPGALLSALEEKLAQFRELERICVYASMRQDEDLSDPVHSSMDSRATTRLNETVAAWSFLEPELLAIPDAQMESLVASEALSPYRTILEEILRYRPHVLSKGEELLLSMSRDMAAAFQGAFGKLSNVDMPARLPEVRDGEGNLRKITNANLAELLEEQDRGVREAAFLGYYSELRGNRETAAALLDGEVKSNIFRARARRHASALEASLFDDRVSVDVYRSLIEAIHGHLPVMYRYFDFRRASLGLDSLRPWDLHTPAISIPRRRYTFDEAVEMTLRAVRPLGEAYAADLARGFEQRWVDRYENVSKRSGAYSGGCYDSHPFILHNFNGTLDSVFTLAHEAGHSMHSLMSRRRQPYHTSDYRIILAEVASTLNEVLLTEMLMTETDDGDLRAYLLDNIVRDFRATVFRQTMFAEFEWLIHSEVERGGALTTEFLDGEYLRLVKLYHGAGMDLGGDAGMIASEWARIPHFYYNFYVYKYATGLCSAVAIARRILDGAPGALESYLDFLSAGSSKPPLELLRAAGIDLETPAPVSDALGYLSTVVDRLAGR